LVEVVGCRRRVVAVVGRRVEQERQRGDRERLRAERLAEKLRQAGIELDDEE